MPEDGFEAQTDRFIELTDEIRAKVIKRAHDLSATLVEFHSHLYQSKARFSESDLIGFNDFVPHVMWRLKRRPYVAIVVAGSTFDGLVWLADPKVPVNLTELRIGPKSLSPTGTTLNGRDTIIK